jgi:hypothetical protein
LPLSFSPRGREQSFFARQKLKTAKPPAVRASGFAFIPKSDAPPNAIGIDGLSNRTGEDGLTYGSDPTSKE